MSACTIVCDAVQLISAPTAKTQPEPTGYTRDRHLRIRHQHVRQRHRASVRCLDLVVDDVADLEKLDSVATFVIDSDFRGVVTSEQTLSAPVAPSSTHAWLKYEPASMSAWTIVCDAVQLILRPPPRRNRTDGMHTRSATFGSVTNTFVSVT